MRKIKCIYGGKFLINKEDICYWSVSWGDYSYMAQSLVDSMRQFKVENDFILFSDKNIRGCINVELDSNLKLDLGSYMFKFEYLKNIKKFGYKYNIFIDVDSIFVREPDTKIDEILKDGSPWHSFLESPINSKKTSRSDWWHVKTPYIVKLFRDLGVCSKEIRNTNAGFWICHKDFINEGYALGKECYHYFLKHGYKITEEIPIAYISNYISADNYYRYIENYKNYWCSDWTGIFKNEPPKDEKWISTSYMTGETLEVNPSIIHAMRSKDFLIKKGKNILKTYGI